MPTCKIIDPLVAPFIDGELPAADRRLVEDHLRACPPCHSRVVAERAVHTIIRARADLLRAPAPPALRARCHELAARPAGSRQAGAAPRGVRGRGRGGPPGAPGVSRAAPYALAASLILVVGTAFLIQATRRS